MQNTVFCLQQTGKLITFKIAAKAIATINCIVNFKDIQQSFFIGHYKISILKDRNSLNFFA